jgi:hypothetical protein
MIASACSNQKRMSISPLGAGGSREVNQVALY